MIGRRTARKKSGESARVTSGRLWPVWNDWRFWIRAFCALLVFDLVATLAYNAWAGNLSPRAGGALVFAEAVPAFDAAIVLCAGIGPHRGLDAVTRERLRFAAELYRRGRVREVAGVGGHWRKNRLAGLRQGMSEILLEEAGLPAGVVVQDRDSYDTLTNLDEVFRLAAERGWRRIVFVSSPLHLRRVLHLAARHVRPAPVRSPGKGDASASVHRTLIEFAPLPFTAVEQANALAAWRETHHEWAAWAMTLILPDEFFRDVMRWRRL